MCSPQSLWGLCDFVSSNYRTGYLSGYYAHDGSQIQHPSPYALQPHQYHLSPDARHLSGEQSMAVVGGNSAGSSSLSSHHMRSPPPVHHGRHQGVPATTCTPIQQHRNGTGLSAGNSSGGHSMVASHSPALGPHGYMTGYMSKPLALSPVSKGNSCLWRSELIDQFRIFNPDFSVKSTLIKGVQGLEEIEWFAVAGGGRRANGTGTIAPKWRVSLECHWDRRRGMGGEIYCPSYTIALLIPYDQYGTTRWRYEGDRWSNSFIEQREGSEKWERGADDRSRLLWCDVWVYAEGVLYFGTEDRRIASDDGKRSTSLHTLTPQVNNVGFSAFDVTWSNSVQTIELRLCQIKWNYINMKIPILLNFKVFRTEVADTGSQGQDLPTFHKSFYMHPIMQFPDTELI
ncbi:hypothetical protein ACTXT7_004708 [Hymenolepis weldensis]